MDHRLRPGRSLGLAPGSAGVIRNAGGRVTEDALGSLVVASSSLGVNEIVVVQHTECGLATVTNEQIVEDIQQELDVKVSAAEFLSIADLRSSIQADVRWEASDRRCFPV
jgi:carbonic anhydrase